MTNLYYGNGNCSIEGSGVVGVFIRYRGAIEITDKTPDKYNIIAYPTNLTITSISYKGITLNNLFDYRGEFNIISAFAFDGESNEMPVSIKQVMDYSELLNTKSEDMTTKSEDLKVTHLSKSRVARTTVDKKTMDNLHTKDRKGALYLETGELYEGPYHIHIDGVIIMTGEVHSGKSQDLYYMKYINGRPTGDLVICNIREVLRYKKMELRHKDGSLKDSKGKKIARSAQQNKGGGYGL